MQMGVQGRKALISEGISKAEAKDGELVRVADLVLSLHCLTVIPAAVTEACPRPHILQSAANTSEWSRQK